MQQSIACNVFIFFITDITFHDTLTSWPNAELGVLNFCAQFLKSIFLPMLPSHEHSLWCHLQRYTEMFSYFHHGLLQ